MLIVCYKQLTYTCYYEDIKPKYIENGRVNVNIELTYFGNLIGIFLSLIFTKVLRDIAYNIGTRLFFYKNC